MKYQDFQVGEEIYVMGYKRMTLARVAKVRKFARRTKVTLDNGSEWEDSGYAWDRGSFGSSPNRIARRSPETEIACLRLRAGHVLGRLTKHAENMTKEQAETVVAFYESIFGKDGP